MAGGAPEISLGQKYLTTADPFDPNYNTPDLHPDLKKLTCPTSYGALLHNLMDCKGPQQEPKKILDMVFHLPVTPQFSKKAACSMHELNLQQTKKKTISHETNH